MKGKSVILLLVLALLTLLAVVAIWTLIVPKYQAKGEVRIQPFIPRLVFNTEDNGMIPFYESYVNTQVSVMKSTNVLQRVLDQRDVRNTEWFKNPRKTLRRRLLSDSTDPPLTRLQESLSILPRLNTEIIDVSFTDTDAKDAQVIVNEVLDQYLMYVNEASDQVANELYRKLIDQFNILKSEVVSKENKLISLRKELGAAEPQELITDKRIRLDQMRARLTDLRNRIKIMEESIKQTGLIDSNEVVVKYMGLDKLPEFSADPEWRKLNENVSSLRQQLMISGLTTKHPQWIKMKQELEFAMESLRLREEQLSRRWRDRTENEVNLASTEPNVFVNKQGTMPSTNVYDPLEGVKSLKERLELVKKEEQQLSAEVETERREFNKLIDMVQLYEKESAELKHKSELFDAVRLRKEQREIERNVPRSSISILSYASVSTEPYKDRRIMYTAIVLTLYLIVGSCITILGRKKDTAKEGSN